MKKRTRLNKRFISFFLAVMMVYSMAFSGLKVWAATTDTNNGDWSAENVALTNTSEAQLMVRVGDIDNFGFGWGNINPFSGKETSTHSFPFYPSGDSDGTDRIMVVSGYDYSSNYKSTGSTRDGYTEKTSRNDTNGKDNDNNVRSININYDLSNISVNNATIQMFVDDFQPGNAKGVTKGNVSYIATINGQEVPELSNVINNLDESGPIGKLITFQIPERFLDFVRTGGIAIKIDDNRTDRTGDGYAIDFAKLLINKTSSTTNTATIRGNVKDTNNNNIEGAIVSAGGVVTASTGSDGNYVLNNVPAGQAIVTASKTGYNSQTYTEKTVIAGYGYTHNFTLTPNTPPTTPTITTTPTAPTNTKVTATIRYSSDSTIQQYRINLGNTIGEWKIYTGNFDVTQNCTIDAQGTNQYGNTSQIASYTVGNIDTTPPTLTLTPSIVDATNGTVTITATASDSGSGVASITKPDKTVVTASSTTSTVNANGTYTFMATDNAGNATTQNIIVSNISMPQVKITVIDATGTLDEYSASSDNILTRIDKDVTDKNYILKGDSYANFSLNSSSANAFQYSIIKGNKPINMPTNGWNTIDLQSQVVNQDVVLDKQGYLTQRAYDVNHMITLADTKNWSDPTQVFKYPYPEIGYKSADTSTTKDAYGVMEKVVPYTITDVNGNKTTVDTRWASNTAFMSNMDIFGGYKEASKFWGYIKVPADGNYIFGAVSDDGCRGWITVNGESKQFVNMFQPQGATFGTNNVSLNLKQGEYYPIYLEYFNWGGSAAFQLKYVVNQTTLTNNSNLIPKDWFFPSKSTTPGEYDQTMFTGSKGVKLPNSPGQYYIAYRTGTKNSDGNISSNTNSYREGIYGPFTVKPIAPLELTKKLNSDTIVNGKKFEINYTITPKPISIADFSNTNTQNFDVSNLKFSESLPVGLNIDTSKLDPNKLEIALNGNDRDISGVIKQTISYELDTTGTQYIAQPISFSIWVSSATANTYNMLGKDSYITYLDLDGGSRSSNFNDLNIVVNSDNTAPTLDLIANPTTPTNSNVTITATASDSGSGVASITNLKATDGKAQGTITNPTNSVINNGIVTNADGTVVKESIITYTVSTNGTYQFAAKDNAGNVTTQSIIVSNIDTVGPSLTLTPNITTITNGDVIITVNATDNVAVASITTPDKKIVSGSATTYTVTENGDYIFKAADTAGNVTTETIKVSNIDKTPPTLTLSPSTTNWTNKDITITASGYDSISGVKSITLPNGTEISGSSASFIVSNNGTYTFLIEDNVGNTSTQSINIGNIDKIAPSLSLSASNTNWTSDDVIITAIGSDNLSGVKSIKLPDGNYVSGSSTSYTVTDNDTYTFVIEDNAGNTTTKSIEVSNIYGQSIILNHALYNGNVTDLINDNNSNNNVTASIPVTLAMIVDVESSNPKIYLDADTAKIAENNIVFKKYEILDNETIDKDSLQTITLNKSGDIKLTGLTTKRGGKYIIIYTITPVGSGQVTLTATADGTSSKSVTLTIGDKPDLF